MKTNTFALLAVLATLLSSCTTVGRPWQPEYAMKECLIADNARHFLTRFGEPSLAAATIAKWDDRPTYRTVAVQQPLNVRSDVSVYERPYFYEITNTVSVSGGGFRVHNATDTYLMYATLNKERKPDQVVYHHSGYARIPVIGDTTYLNQFAKLMETAKAGNLRGLKKVMEGNTYSERDLMLAAIEAIKKDKSDMAVWLMQTYNLPRDKKIATWHEKENRITKFITREYSLIYGEPRHMEFLRDELTINEALEKFKAEDTIEALQKG